MDKRILLPLDGTRESERVIPLIEGQLQPGTEVVLLKVLSPAPTRVIGGHVVLGSQREEAESMEAMVYLQGVAGEQLGDSQPYRCAAIVAESSSQGIVDFASRKGIDLIAMYVRERRGLPRFFKGNTAREVRRKTGTKVRTFGPGDFKVHVARGVGSGLVEQGEAAAGAASRSGRGVASTAATRTAITQADLFKELSAAEIDAVAVLGEPLSVSAGESLGGAGEPSQRLYVIVEGEAQLFVHTQIGEITVRVVGPGESFPLAALLGTGTLITAVKAQTDMEVLAIPCQSLLELCAKAPELGVRVFRAAAQIFASRYSSTLAHLGIMAERELGLR